MEQVVQVPELAEELVVMVPVLLVGAGGGGRQELEVREWYRGWCCTWDKYSATRWEAGGRYFLGYLDCIVLTPVIGLPTRFILGLVTL